MLSASPRPTFLICVRKGLSDKIHQKERDAKVCCHSVVPILNQLLLPEMFDELLHLQNTIKSHVASAQK